MLFDFIDGFKFGILREIFRFRAFLAIPSPAATTAHAVIHNEKLRCHPGFNYKAYYLKLPLEEKLKILQIHAEYRNHPWNK